MIDELKEFEPSHDELETILTRRRARNYQRNCRGDLESARDLYEDACIILALEAVQLSEGQTARALQLDRVSLREKRLRMIALGRALSSELINFGQQTPPTSA